MWPSIIWILSRTQSNNDEPQPEASKRRQRTKSKLKVWMRPLLFFLPFWCQRSTASLKFISEVCTDGIYRARQSLQPYRDTLQTTRQGLMDKYRQERIFFGLEEFKYLKEICFYWLYKSYTQIINWKLRWKKKLSERMNGSQLKTEWFIYESTHRFSGYVTVEVRLLLKIAHESYWVLLLMEYFLE